MNDETVVTREQAEAYTRSLPPKERWKYVAAEFSHGHVDYGNSLFRPKLGRFWGRFMSYVVMVGIPFVLLLILIFSCPSNISLSDDEPVAIEDTE